MTGSASSAAVQITSRATASFSLSASSAPRRATSRPTAPLVASPSCFRLWGTPFREGGFFCLQFPKDVEDEQCGFGVNAAILSASPGLLSKEILEIELPHLFEGAWDWQVAQIDTDSFSVVFPNSAMLRMATRSGKLFLSINNITALIRDAVTDAPKGETMPEVWVKL